MKRPVRYPIEGGCDCRRVRYRMMTAPLFVHCCHCRWCQRESGAAFALNAMIEADPGDGIDELDRPDRRALGGRDEDVRHESVGHRGA